MAGRAEGLAPSGIEGDRSVRRSRARYYPFSRWETVALGRGEDVALEGGEIVASRGEAGLGALPLLAKYA